MSLPLERLEAEALALPAEDRATLAHRLIASLDEETDDDPAEVAAAWEREIRHRVAELENGTAEFRPADQVFADLRARAKE